MIKVKIKVLENVSDDYGVTLVMRRRELKKTQWWKRAKVVQEKTITIFTTFEKGTVRWPNFEPLTNWLVVNPAFRYYEKDHMEINIRGILKDPELAKTANLVLTV